MGFLDDVINPVGAITGVDPVKQMTGFTGTGFDKKPGASSSSGGTSGGGGYTGGGGGSGPPPSAGQYMQQFQQQQGGQFSHFGNQLASMANQMSPATMGIGNITSPSAQNVAAAVTSQSIQNKQQQAQMFGSPPQNFWSNFPA